MMGEMRRGAFSRSVQPSSRMSHLKVPVTTFLSQSLNSSNRPRFDLHCCTSSPSGPSNSTRETSFMTTSLGWLADHQYGSHSYKLPKCSETYSYDRLQVAN